MAVNNKDNHYNSLMEESWLVKFALTGSLVGLIVLLIISKIIEPNQYDIQDIANLSEATEVEVKGVISGITDIGNMALIDIVQPASLPVVLFKDGQLELTRGAFVVVQGELRDYKGTKEIIANKIEIME